LAARQGGEAAVAPPQPRVAGGQWVGAERRVTGGGGEAEGVPELKAMSGAGRRG
jgi:hypothetical protein